MQTDIVLYLPPPNPMVKKTLFLSLQALSPMHQATEVELIKKALKEGEEVWLMYCGAKLSTCSFNPTHNLIGCAMCTSRAVHWAEKAGIPTERLVKINRDLFSENFPLKFPETMKALMNLCVGGVNIGRGAASSTISILREYNLNFAGRHRDLIELQLCNALGAFRNYEAALDQIQPDRVVLFNGRHSELWPMIGLCVQRGVDYATHERGGNNQLYEVFEKSLPHSIAARRKIMDETWESAPIDVRREAALNWYRAKRRGTHTNDKNYLGKQSVGILPRGFDATKHNIIIFNSSEDEMQAIPEWKTPLFRQQNEVIVRVLGTLAKRSDIHIYIRMHPNLIGVDNQQTKELYVLSQSNLTLLRPEDSVDTYALLEAGDVVLTFASSAGVEATFWGTPSILFGRAFYEGDDAVYQPGSFRALIELLCTRSLATKNRDNVLKYGYFVSHYGDEYEYAEVRSPADVTILDERMERINAVTLLQLLLLFPQLLRWLATHQIVLGTKLKPSQITKLYSHLRAES